MTETQLLVNRILWVNLCFWGVLCFFFMGRLSYYVKRSEHIPWDGTTGITFGKFLVEQGKTVYWFLNNDDFGDPDIMIYKRPAAVTWVMSWISMIIAFISMIVS